MSFATNVGLLLRPTQAAGRRRFADSTGCIGYRGRKLYQDFLALQEVTTLPQADREPVEAHIAAMAVTAKLPRGQGQPRDVVDLVSQAQPEIVGEAVAGGKRDLEQARKTAAIVVPGGGAERTARRSGRDRVCAVLVVDIGHEAEVRPASHCTRDQPCTKSKPVCTPTRLLVVLLSSCSVPSLELLTPVRVKMIGEVDVAGAAQPVNFPIRIGGIQAEEGVDFNV